MSETPRMPTLTDEQLRLVAERGTTAKYVRPEGVTSLDADQSARIAELEAKVARVEALVRDAERTYALSAHKPNINYELGFIDLMRFIRAALKGNSNG